MRMAAAEVCACEVSSRVVRLSDPLGFRGRQLNHLGRAVLVRFHRVKNTIPAVCEIKYRHVQHKQGIVTPRFPGETTAGAASPRPPASQKLEATAPPAGV